jgi:hypothetical protein
VLRLIEDLPEGIVGVEARGTVTAEDYERVLVPAVEARASPARCTRSVGSCPVR